MAGFGVGRSRGGLTTKMHRAVDRNGRPLAAIRNQSDLDRAIAMNETCRRRITWPGSNVTSLIG